MIRALSDVGEIRKGDLLMPVRRFTILGGYEYAFVERISDGRKFKLHMDVVEKYFDDPDREDVDEDE